MRCAKLIPALASFAPLFTAVSLAEPGDPLTDRLSVSAGTFLLSTETNVRIDGAAGDGTEIDAERDLGLHDANRFRLDAYWRFKKRHKLRLLYFDTKRSSERIVKNELQIGDIFFPIDARLTASLDTRVAELAYEYAFLRRENYEVSGTFGIHDLRFKLDASASQTASGETLSLTRTAEVDGPLPVVGMHGIWRLNDHFYLDGQAQFFKISFDPYAGRLEDYSASIVWTALKHVGLGVGYNEFVTKVDVNANRFDGNLRWRYGGARIFVNASF